MKLTFQIYQASSQNGETAFEIWFHFLRICKGAKCGDVVLGIKTIDFLLSKGKFLTTQFETLEPFGCEIATLIVSSRTRYEWNGYRQPPNFIEFSVPRKSSSGKPVAEELYAESRTM